MAADGDPQRQRRLEQRQESYIAHEDDTGRRANSGAPRSAAATAGIAGASDDEATLPQRARSNDQIADNDSAERKRQAAQRTKTPDTDTNTDSFEGRNDNDDERTKARFNEELALKHHKATASDATMWSDRPYGEKRTRRPHFASTTPTTGTLAHAPTTNDSILERDAARHP